MIEIRDLEVRIGDQVIAAVPALDVAAGTCAAIVGESGSGKTTTLMAVLGLLDHAEVSGSIRACGVDVTKDGADGLRGSKIALVMQSPQGAFTPTMRLGAVLRRTLAKHGIKGAAAAERTAGALRDVMLDASVLRRYPHEVSGGQAQRFALAVALALGAEVILADEPTSALDVTVQAEVVNVLRRLHDERGLTVLLVSHDLALVSAIADHVTVMKQGRVVESGPATAVFTAPASPYTRELIAAIPALPEEADHAQS
ncbi:ATP-binding cassette domain-containing protein [Nonomuraea sp. NPDC050536]|uniref:ATP-binding cassette domain-containing protein n=1 Tax=Nonomuraea sp. NPDC050536 TaxID=3364366 RepID=UPI0037CA9EB5